MLVVDLAARERVIDAQAIRHIPGECYAVAVTIDTIKSIEAWVRVLVERVAITIVVGNRRSEAIRERNINTHGVLAATVVAGTGTHGHVEFFRRCFGNVIDGA